MGSVTVPYVKVIPDRDGKPAWCYYRRGRVYIPIVDAAGKQILPGQQGFFRAYNKIAEGFAARPAEEELLLAVSAQVEAAAPWVDRRPPGW